MGERKTVNLIFVLAVLLALAASVWWLFIRQPFRKNLELGLDLQSGTHLLLALQPDYTWQGTPEDLKAVHDSISKMRQKKVKDEILKPLTAAEEKVGDQALLSESAYAQLRQALAQLGDVQEAVPWQTFLLKLKLKEITPDDLQKVKDVLVRRTDEFGTKEPVIQSFGANHIIVDLPAVTDPKEAEKIATKQAFLEFKELTPAGIAFFEQNRATPNPNDPTLWKTAMTGADLKDAGEEPRGGGMAGTGEYVVHFVLTKQGTKIFADLTSRNVKRPIGIYLDGKPLSSPIVNEPILAGDGIIESFTLDQAHELGRFLRAGALPIPIKVVESVTVGPTLGHEALMESLSAGVLGLLMVMAFMMIFYRVPGIFANVSLIIYAVWLLTAMSIFHFILTLPGIAGIVLSVGMAVDANILIFERLKEELWSGKSLTSAVDVGFQRAWSSILDSHVTVIVGAAALIWKGSSSVQGFGWALLLGTAISLLTAWGVTRVLMDWVVLNNLVVSRKAYGV